MSLFTPSWRRARDLAQQHRAAGRFEESLHYLVHAIRSAPRRPELVQDYAAVAAAHADEARSAGRVEEAVRRLELLEAFVHEATAQVKVNDVAGLLALAGGIAARRAELAAAVDTEEALEPAVQESAAPEPADGARSAAPEPADAPDALGEAVQVARGLLADAAAQSAGVAATLLATADLTLRPAVAFAVRERPAALPDLEALLGELRTRADALAAGFRSREADEAWSTFLARRAPLLEAARAWPPPAETGACEARLGRIRELLLEVAQLGPALAGTPRDAEVQKLATELRGIGERLGREQSDRYNRWAMEQMKKGFDHAVQEAGLFGDLEKVGQRLIDHYGPIDVRHLQHEVARCHSETFEHLFAKLSSPPDSDTAASKLFVLKALFAAKKLELREF